VRSFLGAVSLLTRIPARGDADTERTVPWLPVVGALIGAVAAAVYAALRLALAPLPSATVAIVAGIALTGALHEDGLADTADAFGARVERERTLEIMKDPHNGTFGVLALAASVFARIAAVAAMGPAAAAVALPAAHALGRSTSAVLMWMLPSAGDGLGARYSARVSRRQAAAAAAVGLAITIGSMGAWGLAAAAVAGVGSALAGSLALRKIGGVTGDVLGAAEQLTEIGILLLGASVATGIPWWRG
jgi:adenosylcobinamide-GDP ribazoletransferase